MSTESRIPRSGRKVAWGEDAENESWHQDSTLPASENLSGFGAAETEPPAPAVEEPEEVLQAEAEPEEIIDDKKGRRRSQTIARKQMLRERRRMVAQGSLPEVIEYERPQHRNECRDGHRPCLFVSCRYHLYLDVNPTTGSIKINFPDLDVRELDETCALDVAEKGGITLEEVGDIMNLTRERIRQVEVSGLGKLRTGEVEMQTFLEGRELAVGGPTLEGRSRLPIVE